MTDKLRVYLYYDDAVALSLRPGEKPSGRPALKHKLILSSAEDQSQPLSFLAQKFCDKYNSQPGLADNHKLDPAELSLRLAQDPPLKPTAHPVTNYISDYNDVHLVFLPVSAAAAQQHEPGSVCCTNFGCGKRFVPGRDDGEGSCKHHAGRPVFHDTYKFWSCCPAQKSLEFADFEKVPPCATGVHRHDTVSSAVAVSGSGGGSNALDRKPLTEEELKKLADEKRAASAAAAAASASTSSAGAAFDTKEAPAAVRGPREFEGSKAAAANTEPQKPDAEGKYRCRRYGCQKNFLPDENGPTACTYHVQGPVFHDTYKYWMCCPKQKCADFSDFEKIVGCAVGEHLM